MDEDDVLNVSNEKEIDVNLTLSRLRKRSKFDQSTDNLKGKYDKKAKAIINSYQFNKEDENPYISADESCESSEEFDRNVMDEEGGRNNIRNMLEIEDDNVLFLEAFRLLNLGRVNQFLNSGIIKRKFKSALTLLEKVIDFNVRTRLWNLLWDRNLYVVKSKHSIPLGSCIACNRQRRLNYRLYQNDTAEKIGIMGSDCFEVRFQKLIDLRDVCYMLSLLIHREDFYEIVEEQLEIVFDKINGAEAEMVKRYPID